MRKTAFTLAEVLVALAIVGVIAALTLPNIMRLNQEAGIGPMLASVQTSVEEAAGRMLVDNPNKTLSKMDAEGLFIGYLNRQLAMLDKTNDANPNAQGYALTNGAILNFVAPNGTVPAGTAFKDVVVDINGENRPNANGIDKFTFTLSSNGFLAPQGCAKVISDNNWKVPKDYDPTACNPTAYNPSEGTGGTVGTEGEDCELPKILMPDGTCCNPATDPTCQFAPQTCEPTPCDDPDLEAWIQSACDCIPVRKRCPDGSIIDINASCEPGGCVEQTCTGGKQWNADACVCECPENTVEQGGQCVPVCVVKTCDPQFERWDSKNCKCETVKKRCPQGNIISINATCSKLKAPYIKNFYCYGMSACAENPRVKSSQLDSYLQDGMLYNAMKDAYSEIEANWPVGEDEFENFDLWFKHTYNDAVNAAIAAAKEIELQPGTREGYDLQNYVWEVIDYMQQASYDIVDTLNDMADAAGKKE